MVEQGAAPAGVLETHSTHSGGAGAPPGGQYGLPARSLADGWPRVARSTKSAAGAVRRTLRWRAERRPCSREGVRHLQNNGCATWRAIPPQIEGTDEEDGPTRGLDKQHGR